MCGITKVSRLSKRQPETCNGGLEPHSARYPSVTPRERAGAAQGCLAWKRFESYRMWTNSQDEMVTMDHGCHDWSGVLFSLTWSVAGKRSGQGLTY